VKQNNTTGEPTPRQDQLKARLLILKNEALTISVLVKKYRIFPRKYGKNTRRGSGENRPLKRRFAR
jgi:hypothetical protein